MVLKFDQFIFVSPCKRKYTLYIIVWHGSCIFIYARNTVY